MDWWSHSRIMPWSLRRCFPCLHLGFFACHNWCHCGEIWITQCWYGCRTSSLIGLKEVFNKEKAQSLPPHRSYVCHIDFFWAGAPLPTSRLFQLSRWERSPAAVHLRPASCRASLSCFLTSNGGFYLLRRKIRHLDPDIRWRHAITVTNKYPLPPYDSSLKTSSGAKIFCKLDLRNLRSSCSHSWRWMETKYLENVNPLEDCVTICKVDLHLQMLNKPRSRHKIQRWRTLEANKWNTTTDSPLVTLYQNVKLAEHLSSTLSIFPNTAACVTRNF